MFGESSWQLATGTVDLVSAAADMQLLVLETWQIWCLLMSLCGCLYRRWCLCKQLAAIVGVFEGVYLFLLMS